MTNAVEPLVLVNPFKDLQPRDEPAPSSSPAPGLTDDENDELVELVKKSIVRCYEGKLEQHEGHDGAVWFTPFAPLHYFGGVEEYYRLWGGRISREVIEEACRSLDDEGAEDWPLGYTQADAERHISRLDHELEMHDAERDRLQAEADKWRKRSNWD